jgi:hypothetical protein
MIYRGPGFLAAPPPLHSPLPPSASCLSFSVFLCVASRVYCDWRGEGGGGGAKSYDIEKAWPDINHSILSDSVYSEVKALFPILGTKGEQSCEKNVNMTQKLIHTREKTEIFAASCYQMKSVCFLYDNLTLKHRH